MRINALMTAYNTEEFVRAAIDSVYDYVDEIVILEGSWSNLETPRSKDKTWDIIESHPDLGNKLIRLRHDGTANPDTWKYVSQEHQENTLRLHSHPYYNGTALQKQLLVRDYAFRNFTDPTGWLFFVDSDEVYKPEDIEAIMIMAESIDIAGDTSYNSITLPGRNFYFGYKYYATEFYQRLIRIPPHSLRPYMRRTCSLGWDGAKISNTDLDIGFYHYGYVGYDRVKEKLTMWDEKVVNEWFARHIDLWNGAKYDGRGVHLLQGVNPVYSKYMLEEFKGQHPLQIQEQIIEINNNSRHSVLQ